MHFGVYSILIVILFPVKAQYIIKPSRSYALYNREFRLTCDLGPLSTVPTFGINWRRNGVIVAIVQSSNCQANEGRGGKELYQRYTYNCLDNKRYYLHLTATRNNSEEGSVWKCEDNSNPLLGSSNNYTLVVYDPPTTDPMIYDFDGRVTYPGDRITLTCSVTGGNPLATLTWTCKGVTAQTYNENLTTLNLVINRYMFTIDSSYNGQICTCTASHQLWVDDKVVHSQPFIVYSDGQNARITAQDTFILNTQRIHIDCQPAGLQFMQINVVSIMKDNRPLVSAVKTDRQTTINWQDSSIQSRATTNTPDLTDVSTSQLRVTIEATNTQCDDEAVYTCRVDGLDENFNAVSNNEVSHNITVEVKPDRMNEMQVFPLPSAEGQYSKGEKITLSCTGTVGAYTDPPNITWCIQRSGEFNPTDLESDNNYRSMSQTEAQPVGSGQSCQFQRTSAVVYEVDDSDTATTFFCQITAPRDNGICGQGTVRQQKSIEVAQATQACGTGIIRGGDNMNTGLLIGTIIGGVTSITLAVILVIVFIHRCKNQSTEKAAVSNQYRQENMAYETLDSRVAISEVSVYNTLSNTDNDTGQHLQSAPTYDRLDGTQTDGERNTYQILTDSRSNAQEMNTEYEIPNSY